MYPDIVKYRAIIHYKYFLKSIRRVSAIYNVSKSTLARWLQKDGITIHRKKTTSIVNTINDYIASKLLDNPFLTALQSSKCVKQELGITASKSTVWKCIRANKYTYKRTKTYVYKPSIATAETTFKQQYQTNVVAIDETFFYINDYPKYGYSLKGT